MKQEISPATAVIASLIVLALVLGIGWKMFLAPKGGSGRVASSATMMSGATSQGMPANSGYGMASGALRSGRY
jgi:uncharacterized membrane protein